MGRVQSELLCSLVADPDTGKKEKYKAKEYLGFLIHN